MGSSEREYLQEGAAAAARWRLPFGRQAWRGAAGNWSGVGAGNSLDFQDHRNYVPGDDPRHIHWQAYARTGALTMKLYRAEVAPYVDVLVDASASMRVTPAKAARVDALLAFCVASAQRAGAPVRIHAAQGSTLRVVSAAEVSRGHWRERETASMEPGNRAPGPFAWRSGALKVLISDLLFAGDPAVVLRPMAGMGAGVVLAPAVLEESALPWRGNVELVDCEGGARRLQRVDEGLADRYHAAYQRHFSLWREAARRYGMALTQVACEGPLLTILGGEPFTSGAVEVVR